MSSETMATLPEIPADYCCPLCPGHQDIDFIWSELAKAYLCDGCWYEIACGLDFEQQPTFDEYNCADTIDSLLALLDITYEELKRRHRELSENTACDTSCHILHVK